MMILSLFAGCGPAAEPNDSTPETTEGPKQSQVLSVGFGKVDVTPKEPVPMNGLHENRISEDVRDPLYCTCIAFTDEFDNTVIMFAMESLYAYDVHRFAASDISKKTGVPFGNIMIGTNHSHSSPSIPNTNDPSIERYSEMLREKMVEAAEAALADRKPAKMYITTEQPETEWTLDLAAMTLSCPAATLPVTMPAEPREALMQGRWDAVVELMNAPEAVAQLAATLPAPAYTPAH